MDVPTDYGEIGRRKKCARDNNVKKFIPAIEENWTHIIVIGIFGYLIILCDHQIKYTVGGGTFIIKEYANYQCIPYYR